MSWEGLSDLAPIVPMLQHLKKQLTQSIGTPYQGMKHSAPDVNKLIYKVFNKAEELISLVLTPGREIIFEAQDILEDGAALLKSSRMRRFKKCYKKWVQDSTRYSSQMADLDVDGSLTDANK